MFRYLVYLTYIYNILIVRQTVVKCQTLHCYNIPADTLEFLHCMSLSTLVGDNVVTKTNPDNVQIDPFLYILLDE